MYLCIKLIFAQTFACSIIAITAVNTVDHNFTVVLHVGQVPMLVVYKNANTVRGHVAQLRMTLTKFIFQVISFAQAVYV